MGLGTIVKILPLCRAQDRFARRSGKIFTISLAVMRIRALGAVCVLSIVVASVACGRAASFFRQYEYEEEMYVSLDGTATVYVNASIPALNALRGTSFDTRPTARVDVAAVRSYFSSPVTHVTWVRQSRRSGRRFVHVRLDVDDLRKLSAAAPFAWSTYTFDERDGLFVYRQHLGAAARKEVGGVGWTGRELVAFRLHLPSKIRWQNSGGGTRRGNILVWERPLADRLAGAPIDLEARMDTESILYRTLWLFGATFVAVGIAFALVLWWVLRRAPDPVGAPPALDSRA
jgi:hypothetical protein